jgi:hypothetical protein
MKLTLKLFAILGVCIFVSANSFAREPWNELNARVLEISEKLQALTCP